VFVMTCNWVDPYTSSYEVLYLTGYSDFPELNPTTGTVDENMVLFPNTAILLVRVDTANGPVLKIKHSFTIEYDTDTNNVYFKEDLTFTNEKLLLRPYDTISVINNVMNGYNTIPIESTLKNTNAIEREDMIPVNHMSTVINSLLQGYLTTNSPYSPDIVTNSKLASKKIDPISNIEFFRKLVKEQGRTPGLSFPLKWLFKLDPSLTGDRIIVANYTTGNAMLMNMANGYVGNSENVLNGNIPLVLTSEMGENAGDATFESKVAVLIRDSVSSLLAKNMLMDIAFTITNDVLTNDLIFQPYFALPAVNGVNLPALVEKFRIELEQLIIPQLTRQGNLIIDVDVYSSIMGDTKIAISINRGEKRLYRFPTFADSLYNSLITNAQLFNETTNTYKQVIDQTLAAVSVFGDDLDAAPVNDHFNNF
jgi:hypothetical protein